MDDSRQTDEAAGLPLQGPHWHADAGAPVPPGFVPLRLVLQPSGLAVALTRPEMVAGRHTDADIRLPLPDVSRRHCRFHFGDARWQVSDLNSLNGVYVNGEQVRHAALSHGDFVGIGGFTFEVELPASAGEREDADGAGSVFRAIYDALPKQAPSSNSRRRAS